MTILAALGGVGGILAVLAAIIVIGRGIFKQVSVTEDLAEAVKGLTTAVSEVQRSINGHETRIAVLEDRLKR